jgi:hypothetical protein
MIAALRIRRHLRQVLLVLTCLAASGAGAQQGPLERVDEAATDLSWLHFKNRLLDAAQKRDRKLLLSILDPNVRSGAHGGRGIAEFRKQWHFDAEDSPLWDELSAALFLGSAYLQRSKGSRELCAPYVLAKWPRDVDPGAYGAIVSRDVLVKEAPSSDSKTLATFSHRIVRVADWEVADQAADLKQKWVRLRLPDDDGFVPGEQIRSPIEHAACFVRTAQGWRMTAFGPAGG